MTLAHEEEKLPIMKLTLTITSLTGPGGGKLDNSSVVFAHFLGEQNRRGAQLSNKFSRIPQMEVNSEH